MKITIRYDLTPVRMAIIKMSTNNKCWRRHGEKRISVYSSWGCKLVHPLWKTIESFLKNKQTNKQKTNNRTPHDTAIWLLSIYPKISKHWFEKIHARQCSHQHYLYQIRHGSYLTAHQQVNGLRNEQWNVTWPWKGWNSAICNNVDRPIMYYA